MNQRGVDLMNLRKADTMTSKERVMTTFAHQEPDRVPVNYFANGGINRNLMEYFGLAADDWGGLTNLLGVDFRGVGAWYTGPRLHAEIAGRGVDPCWGIRTRWIQHDSGGYMDYCDFPLAGADEETIANWPMPNPDHYDYSKVAEHCDSVKDFAVFNGGAGLPDIINSTGMIRTMEQVLVDLITDEPAGLLLIDRKLEIALKVLERTLEAAKGKIDFIWMGEDLGTQRSPIMSLELFRKHIRPRHQKVIDIAKAYNLPTLIHTCGSSSWSYPDMIEMGITGVDTLQPEAVNMSPRYLKDHFGKQLFFHGCISTAGPVAKGSVEDMKAECRSTLDIMMPGGGYCFSPAHCLQDNSKPENVAAMYEMAFTHGRYK
ncbi:MAG: hypothetical protein LLG03_11975 [Planctomycetaceae bacterium]|nr:hypothetical protein [Planctomycetaceae bacterium]